MALAGDDDVASTELHLAIHANKVVSMVFNLDKLPLRSLGVDEARSGGVADAVLPPMETVSTFLGRLPDAATGIIAAAEAIGGALHRADLGILKPALRLVLGVVDPNDEDHFLLDRRTRLGSGRGLDFGNGGGVLSGVHGAPLHGRERVAARPVSAGPFAWGRWVRAAYP